MRDMLTINFDLLSKPVDPIFSMNKNEVQIYKKLVQGILRGYFWYMKIGIIKEYKNPPDKRVVFSPEKCFEIINCHALSLCNITAVLKNHTEISQIFC